MYPFTHYMIAYAAGHKYGSDPLSLRVMTLAALLPDADILSILWGIDAARSFHGTIAHSLFVLPILALALSGVVAIAWKRNVIKWALAGVFMHFVLDLPNTLSYSPDAVFNPVRPMPGINLNPNLGSIGYPLFLVALAVFFGFALYFFIQYVRAGESPWRIWIDERKLLKWFREEG